MVNSYQSSKKSFWWGVAFVLALIVGITFLSSEKTIIFQRWVWIIFPAIAVIALLIFFAGLRKVPHQERWIVEIFGRYHTTLRPGPNWILPGIMKIRATADVWEQKILLFEEEMKIDFRDGSAVPKNAKVFVKMLSPDEPYILSKEKAPRDGTYRSVYDISDWSNAVRDLLENAARTYLNSLTIDEAIVMAKAGFDLATHSPQSGIPNKELKKIERALAEWGFELKRITIQDFDLEPELVKARGEVQIRKREAEAAKYVRSRRAEETMGTLMYMMAESTGKKIEDIQAEINANQELKDRMEKFSEELVTRRMSIDGNALTDVRTSGGGGDLAQSLLSMIVGGKKA